MPEEPPTEAVVDLDMAGNYVDADATALELLGVSLPELRASAPDRFALRPAIEDEAMLHAHWEIGGREPLAGTTSLRRADGTSIHVSYLIEATGSGFRARIWQVEGAPAAPPSASTVVDVLRDWRAAERALTVLAPGTAEWARTLDEIERLRSRYQDLFRR
jgi:PAS domain-containing protein